MQEVEAKITEVLKRSRVWVDGVTIEGKFYPGVTGVSNEPQDKIVAGQVIPGRKAIRVLVERKLPLSELTAEERLPSFIELKDGTVVDLDVVELGHVTIVERTSRSRPFPMGVKERSAQASEAST